MKAYFVTYTIIANDNITEEEMMKRAEQWKDTERNMYKGDCIQTKISVTEVRASSVDDR